MNIDIGETPLVLIAPDGNVGEKPKPSAKARSFCIHEQTMWSRLCLRRLVNNSGLPQEALIDVGNDHWLSDPESLEAMLKVCERLVRKGSE